MAKKSNPASPLMVRLDQESKDLLVRAAELRRISVSDYVRQVTVSQARQEVLAEKEGIIKMTPAEQLEFWTALNRPPRLTPGRKKLRKLLRGEK